MGRGSCKGLREAKRVALTRKGLSVDDLERLGTLGSVLPALESLNLTPSQQPTACSGWRSGLARARCRP